MKHTFCKGCYTWILKSEAYKHWGKFFCERCMNDILEEETNRREAAESDGKPNKAIANKNI